tara:strand:- start:418 stop:702 length:285 start_codon:yes stop_codon:yes gene_type:complete
MVVLQRKPRQSEKRRKKMQKVINTLAVLSFLGTASIIGGGVYVYMQREALQTQLMGKVAAAATEAISAALPSLMDSAKPELPKVTGGASIPKLP